MMRTSLKARRPCLAAALALAAGCVLLSPALSPSARAQTDAGTQDNATAAPEPERQDTYLGTVSESIFMGRDPVTGDNVILVTPPVREEEPGGLGNETEINVQVAP